MKLLRNFFLRDRTSIIYSAGRRSRKPAWDWDLYRELTAFIDTLSAVEDLAKKRKLKVTAALREAMDIARISVAMAPGERDSALEALTRQRERAVACDVSTMRSASRRVAIASEQEEPMRGEKIVRRFFEIAKYHQASMRWIEARSGVPAKTIWTWSKGTQPGFSNFIACLQALGYDLAIKEQDT